MKIKHTKRITKKYLLWGVAVLIVITLGVASFYWVNSRTDNDNIDYSQPTDEQKTSGTEKKREAIEGESKPSGGTDIPPAPTPQPDGRSSIDMAITAANQNGSVFQLKTLIYSVVSDGSCTLRLTRGSTVVTKTSSIQSLANSATCEGFDIPIGELSPGAWMASVSFDNDTLTGSATQEITIE